MTREVAPNLSYHYWGLGIVGDIDGEASPLVMVRGSEFTPEKEITMEDDEGHMGTATTKMSSYRSSATSSPSFTDKTRYKEGWEDMWYLILGSDDGEGNVRKTVLAEASGSNPQVNEYTFKINVANPQDPAFATLYNGFAKTSSDAFVYENDLLSEFEIKGSNEEAPTYTATFASNFPKFNQPNPARVYPSSTVFTKTADVKIYIAPKGTYTSESQLENYMYPCFVEYGLNINNNIENDPCSSDDFGTSTKLLGNRESTFNVTVPWTEATKHLEYMFMGGAADATQVTDENDEKTVWIVFESDKIGSTNYNYKTIIKIPEIVLTNADSPQSGSDAKQIELEGNIQENGVDSFIECVIVTDLEDLHIDNGETEEEPSSP